MIRGRLGGLVMIIILGVLSIATWWAANRTQQTITADPIKRFTHEPDSYARNFFYIRSDIKGFPSTRIEGALIKHFPDDDSLEITSLIAFSQRPDSPLTIGRAQFAILDQDGARLRLMDGATFKRLADDSSAPLTVQSNYIEIYPDDEIAISPNFTTIINANSKISGSNMHYNNIERTLKIKQKVSATIAPKQN